MKTFMRSAALTAACLFLAAGCAEPVLGNWKGVQGNRYDWKWSVADDGGRFDWYDRDRDRSRAGDIDWRVSGDKYRFELDCRTSVNDDCWSPPREFACKLKNDDSWLDCERVDTGDTFELGFAG